MEKGSLDSFVNFIDNKNVDEIKLFLNDFNMIPIVI